MKKINKIIFVIAAICLGMILLRGASFSQQAAGELFEKALYVEEGQGDLQKALGLYQDILKRFPESREVAAKAQLRIGFCYEKLGIKEAEKAFQQVIDNYPEQSGTVREAQEKLKTLARAQTPSEKNPVGLTLRKIWSGELDITARISPDAPRPGARRERRRGSPTRPGGRGTRRTTGSRAAARRPAPARGPLDGSRP